MQKSKSKYQIRNTKYLLAVLLAVLVLGFVPSPAKAVINLDFQVTPNGPVAKGSQTLLFKATVGGVGQNICDSGAFNAYLFISQSEDNDLPPNFGDMGTDFIKILDKNQETAQTLQKGKTFDFGDKTVFRFKAYVVCSPLSSAELSQRAADDQKEIAQSSVVTVNTSGFEPAPLIQIDNLETSWTVSAQKYIVPKGSSKVTIKLTNLSFKIKNKIPRQYLQKGDVLIAGGNTQARGIVKTFQAGIDYFGRRAEDWKCDGAFTKLCVFPILYPSASGGLSNPLNTPTSVEIQFTNDSKGEAGKIYIAESDRNTVGFEKGFAIVPLILVEGDRSYPAISQGQITVRFDNVTEQKEEGGPTSGGGSITDTTSQNSADLGGPIISLVNLILGTIVALLRWVLSGLGDLAVYFLETTLSINASDITRAIMIGWTYVRDVTNMFFIVGLIIIGFGTMLRLESYNYKKLLVNLIIMALLVNFSLLIGRVIIQLADTAQFSFLPYTEGASGIKQMYATFTTSQIPSITNGFLSANTPGALNTTFSLLFQLTLEIGVFLTFGALAVFMLIRTVALYVLLIISPLAYGLYILPATQSLASKWWSNFIKYALFGPIVAFFIRLSMVLYNGAFQLIPAGGSFSGTPPDMIEYLRQLGTADKPITFEVSLQLAMIYIIILAFLWAGMVVTKNMGIAGADAITGIVKKGMLAPIAAGKWVGKEAGMAAWRYTATKYDEKTLGLASGGRLAKIAYGVLHPLKFKKAMKEDSGKDYERAKHLAEAGALKVKRATPLLRREGKDPMFHALMEQGEEELKERFGVYSGNESEEVKRTQTLMDAAIKKQDKKAARMLIAQTLRNAQGKHINQILYEEGLAYNHANLTAHFNNLEQKGIFSESVNEELQTQLSEIGYKIGDSTLTELSDGGKPLEVEETQNSGKVSETFYNTKIGKMDSRTLREYRYKGTKELLEAMEEVRSDPSVTQANIQEKTDERARTKGLNDVQIANARRSLINIRNRNVNVSKIDKFNLFHNSLFTTKLVEQPDGTVKSEVVFGDGGDQAFLNITGGDIWRASRNGIPDKSKEWIRKMVQETGSPHETIEAFRKKFGADFSQWLAARGEHRTETQFKAELEEKVENFTRMIYASEFNKGVDQIEEDLTAAGKRTRDEKMDFLVDKFRKKERPKTPPRGAAPAGGGTRGTTP